MERKAENILNFLKSVTVYPNTSIVYDIDDTLVTSRGDPICPIINTYKYALNKGIKPIIITARELNFYNLQNTINMLNYYGITDYEFLILRPSQITDLFEYKRNARQKMWQKGYNIIASIGDMPWDIGCYGGIGFLI